MELIGCFGEGKKAIDAAHRERGASIVLTKPNFHDINSQTDSFHGLNCRGALVNHEDKGFCHGARVGVGEDLAPMQTPLAPASRAVSTMESTSAVWPLAGPPAKRSGMGALAATRANEVLSPVQTHFAASHPSSKANLTACAWDRVMSSS